MELKLAVVKKDYLWRIIFFYAINVNLENKKPA